MRIDEVIQQPGQKERILKEDILKSIHVSTPGEIVSYDANSRTAVIQPVIRDWDSKEAPPLLTDVPVFFWGNFTFTPKKGDGCLVVVADSCIDSWFQSGGVSTPNVARTHSLSDGFAFVGFRQTDGVDLPETLKRIEDEATSVPGMRLFIQGSDGCLYFEVATGDVYINENGEVIYERPPQDNINFFLNSNGELIMEVA